MKFIFFLEYQHYQLFEKIKKLNSPKKTIILNPSFDANVTLKNAEHCMKVHRIFSSGPMNSIKSFLPGTDAYKARCAWAKTLNEARGVVNNIDKIPFSAPDTKAKVIHVAPVKTLSTQKNNVRPSSFSSPLMTRGRNLRRSPDSDNKLRERSLTPEYRERHTSPDTEKSLIRRERKSTKPS